MACRVIGISISEPKADHNPARFRLDLLESAIKEKQFAFRADKPLHSGNDEAAHQNGWQSQSP